jgi:hypothetical protein
MIMVGKDNYRNTHEDHNKETEEEFEEIFVKIL